MSKNAFLYSTGNQIQWLKDCLKLFRPGVWGKKQPKCGHQISRARKPWSANCDFFASNKLWLFCLKFTVYAPFSGCSWHPSRQPHLRHPLSSRFARLRRSVAVENAGHHPTPKCLLIFVETIIIHPNVCPPSTEREGNPVRDLAHFIACHAHGMVQGHPDKINPIERQQHRKTIEYLPQSCCKHVTHANGRQRNRSHGCWNFKRFQLQFLATPAEVWLNAERFLLCC